LPITERTECLILFRNKKRWLICDLYANFHFDEISAFDILGWEQNTEPYFESDSGYRAGNGNVLLYVHVPGTCACVSETANAISA